MIGSAVGHFKILAKLGKGGMGEVYKAKDTKLGRNVALKFLSLELSGNPSFCARFLREAQAVAALSHPHICTIFETGEYEGRPFFAMEYLEGKSLKDVIGGGGPLECRSLMNVALQLVDALCAAHAKGILHRDLKPANIIYDEQGIVKLVDFGLAKTMNSAPDALADTITLNSVAADSDDLTSRVPTIDVSLTQAGSTLGTLAYMSPEQLRCEELDQRSDLFSLGLVLYELAVGKPAFMEPSMPLQIDAILNRTPQHAASIRPEIPMQLDAVIQRLMQKRREDRFSSAAETREALMSASLTTVTAAAGKTDTPYLSTLGRTRSSSWWIVALLGFGFLGAWLGGAGAGKGLRGQSWHWLGLFGLLLLVCGELVRRKSKRELLRSLAGKTVKVTRLEEETGKKPWWLVHVFFWGVAIFCTYTSVRLGASVPDGPSGAGRTRIVMIIGAIFYWTLAIGLLLRRGKSTTRKWREIEVHGSYAQILASISQIVTDLEARVTGLNLEKGLIRATTSMTWRDFGERVSFSIQESSSETFQVRLESQSASPFTVFDLGKNNENLRRAVDRLAQL